MSAVHNKKHPNQKPIDLLEQFINLFTTEYEVVIDPCMGSGSTLVACRNTNRKFYCFEILEEYYNKIKENL